MVHHLATDISRADLRAAAVSMTPAAVYGFERTVGLRPDVDPGAYQGFFHWVKGGWFAIEVTTIVTGAIAWRLVPFSFVALPIALTAWFMSMDAAPLLIDSPDRADRGLISVVVGLLILGAAFALRRRQRADLNYWLGGGLVLYALWHIVVVALGVLVRSRLLTAVGGLAIATWLSHLAHGVFEDSMVFPFVIVSLGIVVIVAGVGLHRRGDFINDAVDRLVPEALRRLRPDATPGSDD